MYDAARSAEYEEAFWAIGAVLRCRFGKEAGVTIASLAQLAGYLPRRVCERILEERFEDFGFAVVAGSTGYFRPAAADELQAYYDSLRSRARCNFRRMAILRRAAARSGFDFEGHQFTEKPQQLELRLAT